MTIDSDGIETLKHDRREASQRSNDAWGDFVESSGDTYKARNLAKRETANAGEASTRLINALTQKCDELFERLELRIDASALVAENEELERVIVLKNKSIENLMENRRPAQIQPGEVEIAMLRGEVAKLEDRVRIAESSELAIRKAFEGYVSPTRVRYDRRDGPSVKDKYDGYEIDCESFGTIIDGLRLHAVTLKKRVPPAK